MRSVVRIRFFGVWIVVLSDSFGHDDTFVAGGIPRYVWIWFHVSGSQVSKISEYSSRPGLRALFE